MRILYIDDDKIDRIAFDRLMDKFATYHWNTCDSLAKAKELLSNQSFDVVLTDFYLKNSTATKVFDLVDTNARVYAVSGNSDLIKTTNLLSLGFAGFLSKPLTEDALKRVFESDSSVKQESISKKESDDLMAYIRTISDGDEEFELEMLSVILEELPIEMKMLQSAYDKKDWLTLGNALHKMKSKITMLNAHALKEEMAQHETIAKKNSAINKGSFDDLMLKLENLKTSVVLLFNSRKLI